MTAITFPFEPILAINGAGLSNGAIYIGLPNQDPQSFPKAVYWDAALTIPATQPLATIGGYIYNSGSPATAYTAGAYSMRVRDKQGVQVLYQPYVKGINQGFFNALDYGVIPDGTTDNTTTMQAALTAAVSAGGGIVLLPAGTMKVTGTLNINGSGVRVIGVSRSVTNLLFANGSANCIYVNNGSTEVYGVEISNLAITGSAKTGGAAIAFFKVANSSVHDFDIVDCWNGLDINVTNQIYLQNGTVRRCHGSQALKWYAPGDGSARSDTLNIINVSVDNEYLGSDGIVWDGLANTLNIFNSGVLRCRYGLLILNTANSATNVPLFLESFDLAVEGASAQAVRIEGGAQFRFIDGLLTNNHGSSGQGSADTNAVYIAADVAHSVTNSIKFIGCRIGLCANEAVSCAGRSVMFDDCTFPTGGMATPATYSAVHIISPAQDIDILGCRDYEWGAQTNYKCGVLIDSGCSRVDVQGSFGYSDSFAAIINNSADYQSRMGGNGASQTARATFQIQPNSDNNAAGITLTAAHMLCGYYSRSGAAADFTDTTDTATNLAAAVTDPSINATALWMVTNGTAHIMTIQPGAGVTFAGQTSGGNFVIAANTTRIFLVTVTSPAPAAATATVFG